MLMNEIITTAKAIISNNELNVQRFATQCLQHFDIT